MGYILLNVYCIVFLTTGMILQCTSVRDRSWPYLTIGFMILGFLEVIKAIKEKKG